MKSITESLHFAINAEIRHQSSLGPDWKGEGQPGLQPLSERPGLHDLFEGGGPSDMHITLTPGGSELRQLWFELMDAGLIPPTNLLTEGAEVILSGEGVEIHISEDGPRPGTCSIMLCPRKDRMVWTRQST